MEKEGESRGGEESKQPHPKPPPSQPQPHHKCPRCDSLNTKFCYYNNYSLSQPRHFCKSCKRYWTQGGTLRNIPVGGSSRKGKRAKNSSSSSHKLIASQPQPPPHEVVQNQSNLTTLIRPSPPIVVPPTSPYYHGGGSGDGFLFSLATVDSLNLSQTFNQSLNYVGGSTDSGVVSGLNAASLGLQHHQHGQIRPSRFYQMGDGGGEVGSLCPEEQGLIPSSMGNSSAASHLDIWPQSFMNDANHRTSDASLWSTISTTSIGGNSQSNIRGGGSSSLTPNHQWPDLPGNGPPQ